MVAGRVLATGTTSSPKMNLDNRIGGRDRRRDTSYCRCRDSGRFGRYCGAGARGGSGGLGCS